MSIITWLSSIGISLVLLMSILIHRHQRQHEPITALGMSRRMSRAITCSYLPDGNIRFTKMRSIINNEYEHFMRCYQGHKDENTWQCICTMSMLMAWTQILEVMEMMRPNVNLKIGSMMSNIRAAYEARLFNIIDIHHQQDQDYFFRLFFHQLQEFVEHQKALASTIKGTQQGLDLYVEWVHALPFRDEIVQIHGCFWFLNGKWRKLQSEGLGGKEVNWEMRIHRVHQSDPFRSNGGTMKI